ncbi:MAG: ATP-grasp domain-containing protein [Dehalococcoidia bacterium]|nr:ATP-grasp domain-containing protein [Dehalococcoidia bacterium]
MRNKKRGGFVLHIITTRPWKADRLGAVLHDDRSAIDTSGFVDGEDAAWLTAGHASMHWAQATDGWGFQDALWWTLPSEFLGRPVAHGPAPAVSEHLQRRPGFVKLARHKYNYFPAKIRSAEDFEHDLTARPWLPKHEFVWSAPMEIDTEYRVWIANGDVLYACSYHTAGDDRPTQAAPADALALAGEIALHVPGALAVDIATLRSGQLVVVETNPVWCAGFLAAPREVLETALLASQGRGAVADRYIPDAAVQQMLTGTPPRTNAERPTRTP